MITEEKILLLPGAFPASNYKSFWRARSFYVYSTRSKTGYVLLTFYFFTKALFSYEFLLITLGPWPLH